MSEYQSAAAANDMLGARRALLELVAAKDDVADYWAELGKVQTAMGSYGDAYYAFTRAYELDRSNAGLLRAVTELALRSGDLTQAQKYADELDIISPGDPWVKLVKGWAAIGEFRFDEALAISDSLLAAAPFDPSAAVLKARALTGLHRENEAIDLLTKQVTNQPSDVGSLGLLARIYYRQSDWAKVAQFTQRVSSFAPADQQNLLMLVESSLRSGNVPLARKASFRLLQPNADNATIASVLDLWTNYWPGPQRLADARRLAAATSDIGRRLTYAAFFNRCGSPADAMRIAGPTATLPIDAGNAEANAVAADALSRNGNLGGAKARFDAVIEFDPGNATALRGRAELELRTNNAAAAVHDAQKLVTVQPDSSDDRLLLARSFSAAGNPAWAERTLWSAFQDLPGDEKIMAALRATKQGDQDALDDLDAEFARQRDARLNRGLL